MTSTPSPGVVKGTIGEWTYREQLILASAVQRSGDQNWVSVSRAVKPLVEDARPTDYFSQKNCALQYSAMLDKAGTPKRKRTSEGTPEIVETAEQQIVRQLTEKRITELNDSLKQTKNEYQNLKKEIEQLEKGDLDDKIPALWAEMNEELAAKEAAEKIDNNSASLKLKSPPPSNLAKYKAQLKLRKVKSPPPQPGPAEVSPSNTSTAILTTPSPKEEPATQPKKLAESTAVESMDVDQPPLPTISPSKSSRSQTTHAANLPPLKLHHVKRDMSSVSPSGLTPNSANVISPLTMSLSAVMTPKEETLGGVPLQAPHPSTEENLQLNSNMHIIVQQPNHAVMETMDDVKPTPTVAEYSALSAVLPPTAVSSPPIAAPPTAPPTHPQVTSIAPASGIAPSSVAPQAITTTTPATAHVTTPTTTPTPAQPATPIPALMSVSPAVTKPDAPTSTAVSLLPPSGERISVSKMVQPSTQQPIQSPPAVPVPSMAIKKSPTLVDKSSAITVEISRPVSEPSTNVSPPSASEVIQPPTTAAAPSGPKYIQTTLKVTRSPVKMPQSSPKVVQPPPSKVSPKEEQPPAKIVQPPAKAVQPPTKVVEPATKVVPPPAKVVQPPTKVVQPPAKVVQSPTKVAQPPAKVVQPSAKVAQPTTSSAQPSTVTTQPPPVEVKQSPSPAPQPSPKAEQLPSTAAKPPTVTRQAQQPSTAAVTAPKAETAPPPVVTSSPTPTSHPPPPPVTSAASAPIATKPPTTVAISPVSTPHPSLVSTHTPTPSPLVTIAMKAPLVSTATKTPEEKTPPSKGAGTVGGEGKKPKSPPVEGASKSAVRKEEKEKKRALPEEPTRKIKLRSPPSEAKKAEKAAHESSETKQTKKPSATTSVRRSPSSSPSAGAKSAAAPSLRSPKSPPSVKKPKESTTSVSPKSPKQTSKEKREDKKEEEKQEKREEMSTPKSRSKSKIQPKDLSTTPVSQPAEKEKRAAASPVSPSMAAASTPSQEKKTEQEGMETEETPVKVTRSAKKITHRRSRKRKADEEGPSVESTDTEEDAVSSAQTSAVPSPSPSLTGEMDAEAIQAHKQWKKAIMLVWRHAAQHKYANLFLHPVREEDAPGYRDVILRPMDLSSIKKKIESGLIKTDMEFQRDMLLMFQNAFMYNSSDHDVFFMAQSMKSDVMENIQAYLATQAQLQLMGEEPIPQKILRSRDTRRTAERDLYDDTLFSPAKKRRTKGDD